MTQTKRWTLVFLMVTAISTVGGAWALAEDEPQQQQQAEVAAPAADNAANESDAEPAGQDVMDDLLQQRKAPPVIDPTKPAKPTATPGSPGVPAARVNIDPAVLGVAPDQPQPELRREGEFVVSRRGRLVRSPDGLHVLFVFEADGKDSPEPPMVLQACQLLETMENLVQQRGDTVVFILSGQIHTYRGANYLMPTMMKVAVDHGNLHN